VYNFRKQPESGIVFPIWEEWMRKHLWIFCLLVFLPGCLSQTHYDEVMGTVSDIKAIKQHDKKQDQRIDRMEKVLHQLQSGLRSEIRNSGVKVEPMKISRSAHPEVVSGETASAALATGTVKVVKAIDAVKVSLPRAVLFASGSTQINHTGGAVLARIAKGLKSAPENGLIRIVGHSDARPLGDKLRNHFTDNWELSAARAAAVARVFIWGYHISAKRIRVEGRAAVEPVANDAVAAGQAKNRRIEIFIEKG